MKDILNIPFGKGETKVLLKKEIWRNGRTDGTKILTRKRFDHTGLKKTMFLFGNSQSDKSSECKTTESVEHIGHHYNVGSSEKRGWY